MCRSSVCYLSLTLQILDITRLLPPDRRTALENLEEVLECIVIRRARDSNFMHASEECNDLSLVVSFYRIDQSRWRSPWLISSGPCHSNRRKCNILAARQRYSE
jgi:hypothetical protein